MAPSAVTWTGDVFGEVVVPSPAWPLTFFPQHQSVPSPLAAHVCVFRVEPQATHGCPAHAPATHDADAQSAGAVHAFPLPHFVAQPPPQSTSVSVPFLTPSSQLNVPPQPSGAVPHVRPSEAQVLGTQVQAKFTQVAGARQSVLARHPLPTPHPGHPDITPPPQSIPVSLPFLMPSLHVGPPLELVVVLLLELVVDEEEVVDEDEVLVEDDEVDDVVDEDEDDVVDEDDVAPLLEDEVLPAAPPEPPLPPEPTGSPGSSPMMALQPAPARAERRPSRSIGDTCIQCSPGRLRSCGAMLQRYLGAWITAEPPAMMGRPHQRADILVAFRRGSLRANSDAKRA